METRLTSLHHSHKAVLIATPPKSEKPFAIEKTTHNDQVEEVPTSQPFSNTPEKQTEEETNRKGQTEHELIASYNPCSPIPRPRVS
jgi:hypothetical protein